MNKPKQMIGYIGKYDLKLNPQLTEQFKFKEATYTRTISNRGDWIRTKLFHGSLEYEDVKSTTEMLKQAPDIIIVREPFFLDDELRERCVKWVEWANKADPSEYDPFYQKRNE